MAFEKASNLRQLIEYGRQSKTRNFETAQHQGRIKVCGGPRLDTFTGPYLSFISYRHLPALRVRGIIPGKK